MSNTENGLPYSKDQVRISARNRNPQANLQQQPMRNPRMQQQMGMQNQNQMNPNQPQQVIEHDENLSDKEVYPGSLHQQQQMVNMNFSTNILMTTYYI